MGLLAELGYSGTNAPPPIDEVEKKMSSGDLPPEGIHHAVLLAVGPIPNAEGRGWKFSFEILAGPGKGATVDETVWKPKGSDPKKDATTANRILLFAHRLGLLRKATTADGKETSAEVEGKHEFCDCLGATTFIEVQHETRDWEKDGKVRKMTDAKLTFNGLLAADDKKVIAAKVPTATAGAAAEAVASKPAVPKASDFDNL